MKTAIETANVIDSLLSDMEGDAEKIFNHYRGSNFETGRIEVESKTVESPGGAARELNNLIVQHRPRTGWIQTTNALSGVESQSEILKCQDFPILCAEVATAGPSIHVRRTEDGWAIATLSRVEADEGDLIQGVEYMGRRQFGRLHYEVGWRLEARDRHDSTHGLTTYRPYAFRLVEGSDE